MKPATSFICAALALASAAAIANPPTGIFTTVSPAAARYPVTLYPSGAVSEASKCGSGTLQVNLVDVSGELVMAPFIVPESQKFVVTDVYWMTTALPKMASLNPEHHVYLGINSYFPDGNGATRLMVPADRISSTHASANVALTSGPVYVMGTELCVFVEQDGPTGQLEGSPQIQHLRIQGYLMEDDAT